MNEDPPRRLNELSKCDEAKFTRRKSCPWADRAERTPPEACLPELPRERAVCAVILVTDLIIHLFFFSLIESVWIEEVIHVIITSLGISQGLQQSKIYQESPLIL